MQKGGSTEEHTSRQGRPPTGKGRKLNIGRIPYANLYPVFYYLDQKCDHSSYRFISGVPSKLNRMLRSGDLDISPSSSIEFLNNKKRYRVLPWHSISSTGAIQSILLFSRLPMKELGGKTIAVTSASATSTVMLNIILREFYSLPCRFRQTDLQSVRNILVSHDAVLHIGDRAMKEALKLSHVKRPSPVQFVYDLGELWYEHTGLPFVYALWVVRKKALHEKTDLIMKLSRDLIGAKKYARTKLPLIAKEAPQKKWISEKDLVGYWKIISYDFTEKHLEGLQLFEHYAQKLKQSS